MDSVDGKNGENQKINQPGDTAVGHTELAPDKAVSLRPASPSGGEHADALPPADPVAAAAKPADVVEPPDQHAAVPVAPAIEATNDMPTALPRPSEQIQPENSFAAGMAEEPEPDPQSLDHQELAWTASEFIAHPKTMNWYLGLAAITVVILVLAFLINHDIITAVVIVICAFLFGYMASRQPRQLEYAIGSQGITIGPKFYPYKNFRSFALIAEGAFSSIDFMPLKRFAPILSVYCDPEHEPQIAETLSRHLPVSAHKRTMIDELMHRVRF